MQEAQPSPGAKCVKEWYVLNEAQVQQLVLTPAVLSDIHLPRGLLHDVIIIACPEEAPSSA